MLPQGGPPRQLIIVIGRGHGGTRAASWTLRASGVFMGVDNGCGDHVPPTSMYEAARIAGTLVQCTGDGAWDFGELLATPPPQRYRKLVKRYARMILHSGLDRAGWKLPESLLSLPWLVRMFPDAYYIYWTRNRTDAVSNDHLTDDLTRWDVPCTRPKTIAEQRIESYEYQRQLMEVTPRPERVCEVRFEDFVLRQRETLERMGAFLGFELEAIPVDRRWVRTVDCPGIEPGSATLPDKPRSRA